MRAGAKLFSRWVVGLDLRQSCTQRRNGTAGAEFWELEGWSNRRVNSNQAIDSTLQVDSTTWFDRPSGLIRLPGFDSTNILVGSSDILMMNFCWSCPLSDLLWSCQCIVGSWSSRRLDSNRVFIRLSRLIRISGLNQFSELTWLPGINSTLRIDSTLRFE